MKDILLSICIAEFRGGQRCFDLVNNILTYTGDDIEVVVNDNSSDDNTVELLSGINDKRLKIFKNEMPLPPARNWYLALLHGEGMYLQQLNDSDHLQPDYLESFLRFLRKTDYAVIFNYYTKRFYKTGELSALEASQLAIVSAHPSHYVYRRDCFLNSNVEAEFNEHNSYPHVTATLKIIQGKKGYFNKNIPIILPATVYELSHTNSRTQVIENEKEKDNDFSYKGVLRDSLSYLEKIEEYVEKDIQLKVIAYMYFRCIERATCGYRIALTSWVGKRYHLSGGTPGISKLLEMNEDFCDQMDCAIYSMIKLSIIDKLILKLIRYENRAKIRNRFSDDILFIKYCKEIPIKCLSYFIFLYCRQ